MLACSFVFLPCVLQQLLRFLQLKRMICRSISWPLEVAGRKTSDVDFGLITPRNTFLYLSGADGHFYETIQVSESGLYYFAIRNNTDRAIEVLGYVYF